MGKALYVGVSSKARKGKKAYIGVSSKARKIKKMYIGDANGKARLFWSGSNSRFVCNVSVGVTGGDGSLYSYSFMLMDDFKNTSSARVTTKETTSFVVRKGYNFWEKNLFLCTTGIKYFSVDSDAYSSNNNSAHNSNGVNSNPRSLSVADNCLYSIGQSHVSIGGGPSGAAGVTYIHMLTLNEDMTVQQEQLTAPYTAGQYPDTRPASPGWSYSSSGNSASSTYHHASRGIAYNNKLYFLGMTKYYSASQGSTPVNRYNFSLKVVDLPTKTLAADPVYSFGTIEYSQVYDNYMNNDWSCFMDALGFSDGVLLFVDKSIYKLDSNGTSCTKLTDAFSSKYACTSGQAIKITETKFVLSCNVYNSGYQSKVYEFKNGTLTLLKTLSANHEFVRNSVSIDGSLVCAYSKCSSTLGVANHYVVYSLDDGATWTSNEAKVSVGNQTTNSTFYHVIAGDVL